jgi:hypothetical protein
MNSGYRGREVFGRPWELHSFQTSDIASWRANLPAIVDYLLPMDVHIIGTVLFFVDG